MFAVGSVVVVPVVAVVVVVVVVVVAGCCFSGGFWFLASFLPAFRSLQEKEGEIKVFFGKRKEIARNPSKM